MNKRLITLSSMVVLGASLVGCASNCNHNTTETIGNNTAIDNQVNNTVNDNQTNNMNKNEITIEEAKEIALKHANLSRNNVSMLHSNLDYDDGTKIYEVGFHHNLKEYEYEIDANTGSIISYDID